MKTKLVMGAVALIAAMGIISADPWNKKTKLDVKETILIPGKELPPGKYVMKLVDSQSNRHIVQILDETETKVEATILAIPNYRLKLTDGTELRYWETPAGTPPALRAWFYPGDNFGQEFAYPKDVASRIATSNKTQVAWYEGGQDANLKSTELHDFDRGGEQAVAATPPAPEPAPEPVAAPERSQAAPTPEAEPDQSATDVAAQSRSEERTLMAQNQPTPAPTPAADPVPEELPQTGSPLWALGLLGGSLLTAGVILKRRS